MRGSPVTPRLSGMPLKPNPAGVVSVTHGYRSSPMRLYPIRSFVHAARAEHLRLADRQVVGHLILDRLLKLRRADERRIVRPRHPIVAVRHAVADVQLAVGREAVVDARVELVTHPHRVTRDGVVAGQIRQVRLRQHPEQLDRERVQTIRRNPVVGKRIADDACSVRIRSRRRRIVDDDGAPLVVAESAEVPRAFRRGRYRVAIIGPSCFVCRLPAREKERPIAADGTAERAAELVPVQALPFRRRERIARVEPVVAQELEAHAAEAVAAGADRRVDHRACRLPVFGREVVRLDAELRQGVDRRLRHDVRAVLLIDDARVVVDAVEHEAVQHGPRSVGDERAAFSRTVAGRRLQHARRKTRELQEVAAVQRKVADRLAGHDLSDRRGLRREHRRPDDEDGLGDRRRP